MSFGMFTRIEASAGFPAAGLILNWHLSFIGQKNRTRSSFNSKAAFPLQGGLFPTFVEIVRGNLSGIHAKRHALFDANEGMEKSTGPL